MFQPTGLQSLLKDGGKHFAGVDEALLKNIEACKNLSTITQSSLGPQGAQKLIVNHLDKHFVTSDTATIVEQLEVMHPAAKMLVMASKAQEQECGDGTNLAVIYAGEMLAVAEELLKQGIHASDVIKGYELAIQKALEALPTLACWSLTDIRSIDQLSRAIKTCISSKQFGYEDLLAKMVAQAAIQVMPADQKKFDTDNVRVAKIVGGAITKSHVVSGMVHTRGCVGSVTKKEKAKVCVFGVGLEMTGTETKGTVLLENAEQLLNFTTGEENKMEEFVKAIAECGIEVAISGGAISETALHYLNKYNILVLKISSKFELMRLCRMLSCVSLARLGAPVPEEVGYVEYIGEEEMASQKVVVIRTAEAKVSTIVMRAATMNVLDEMERCIDDAVNCVRCIANDQRFVPGAGATEIALGQAVTEFGNTCRGMEQYAVLKFAEMLEVVPRNLTKNAGLPLNETLAALYAAHSAGKKTIGVDVESGEMTCDCLETSVLDHMNTKYWALKFASDAALTVMQVDQIICAKQAGGPKPKDEDRDED